MTGVEAWTEFWGRQTPDAPALTGVTWGELAGRVRATAARLAAGGTGPGDPVAPGDGDLVELVLACAELGAVADLAGDGLPSPPATGMRRPLVRLPGDVVLTHHDVEALAVAGIAAHGLRPTDRVAVTGSAVERLLAALPALHAGAAVVDHGVTVLHGPPPEPVAGTDLRRIVIRAPAAAEVVAGWAALGVDVVRATGDAAQARPGGPLVPLPGLRGDGAHGPDEIGTVRSVDEWPAFWARYTPDRTVLLFGERRIGWAELEDRAARLAGGLRAAGIGKGDRVGFLSRNTPEFFETLIACARLGAILVPFNIRLSAGEMAAMTGDAGLALLICESFFADRIDGVLAQVAAVFWLDATPSADLLYAATPVPAADGVTLADPLLLVYTSGTTGHSKAAVISHGNAAGTAIAVINAEGLHPDDRVVLPAPLAFAGSVLSIGLPFLQAGASMVIERELDPVRLLDDVEQLGVTMIKLVPVIYEVMAATPGFAQRDLSGLRSPTYGGAPASTPLLRVYEAVGAPLCGAYGLTEGCGYNLLLPAAEALSRIGWAGKALPFQRVRIVDEAGAEVPHGEVGELVIAGPCVMQGYWRDPEATAATVRDGWLHTGDLAVMDGAGYVKIVDRAKDMLISGGLNVYPAEVERALRRHPAVVDVAVVGVPDERWGETPLACVVSNDPALTLVALVAAVAGELADYKRPRHLRLVDELPRNANGKILKRALRDLR